MQSETLTGVLSQMCSSTDGSKVTFGDILQALDQRSYGPVLLLPALIAVAPTGAIPGMSLVTGAIIFAVALQLFLGRKSPWLPSRFASFSFSRDRLISVIDRSTTYTKWVDKILQPRLTILVSFPVNRVVALICMIMALTMFPLALLPFAVAIPGTSIALLALGLTARDGLVVLLGFICSAAALGLLAYWFWAAQALI